jgi:hypothetical protein
VSDATLFRFISSSRDEIDFRHTASARHYRVHLHDPARRPNPSDGLPIGTEVTGDLALRIQARPELVPVYERFLSLHQVGTLPSLIDDRTLTVLERPRRYATCPGGPLSPPHRRPKSGVAALRSGDVMRRRPVGRQAPRSSGPSPAG